MVQFEEKIVDGRIITQVGVLLAWQHPERVRAVLVVFQVTHSFLYTF